MIIEIILLGQIAYARSGDKGANANIGVLAYTIQGYAFLDKYLTSDKVGAYFETLGLTSVKRYEMPNIWGLNFVLEGVLAGGGSLSLRSDAQGKALGQAILEMPISVPEELKGPMLSK